MSLGDHPTDCKLILSGYACAYKLLLDGRRQARYALGALFKRWPRLALAVPPDAIRWRPRPGLRAIERLPVTVSAR